jgi:hypothetical protein
MATGSISSALPSTMALKSCLMSASRQPRAEVIPGSGGMITVEMPSLARDRSPVHGAGSAEGDQRCALREGLSRLPEQPHGVGHRGIGDGEHGMGCLLGGQAQRSGDVLADGPVSGGLVQGDGAGSQ